MSSRKNPFEVKSGTYIDRYEIINPPAASEGEFINPLSDKGATSIVFLARQKITADANVRRVIKIFYPNEKIRSRNILAGRTDGASSFVQEMFSLSEWNHENLVKIIDAGEYKSADIIAPYYVMEHIAGENLQDLLDNSKEFYQQARKRAEDDPYIIIRIARQICSALAFMHSKNYFHFDIAPKNIFIENLQGRLHVVVGDLGVTRMVPEVSEASKERTIYIAGTKKYTPPHIRENLSSDVDEVFLSEEARYWDTYSLSCVIRDMIEGWEVTSRPEIAALSILISKVQEKKDILSISVLFKELDRLMPHNVKTAGVDELSSDAAGNIYYINIPLYRVPTTHRINNIISHSEFTRLQLVPQMFLVRSAFPGGVHSMYEHALGTYALTQRVLNRLLSIPRFRAEFSTKELHEAIVASIICRLKSFTFDRIVLEISDINTEYLMKERLFNNDRLGDIIVSNFPDVELDSCKDYYYGRPRFIEKISKAYSRHAPVIY